MNYKTLILGSAATLMLVGGAQAADLAVASSVDYVKVCSAEGAGFFYIPGTDICLKVGGYIRETFMYNGPAAPHFGSQTEVGATFVAKWMSSWGASVIDFQLLEDTKNGGVNDLTLDHANAKVGGLIFGWGNTIAEAVGPYTDFGAYRNDHKVDYFGWAGSAGGFGFALGIENNTAYWGATAKDAPDITAAVTGGMGGLSFTLTGAVASRTIGTGYGVNFGGTWGKAGGLQLAFNVAWAHDAAQFAGSSSLAAGDWESAFLSLQAPIGGGTLLQGTLAWRDGPAAGNADTTYHAAVGIVATLAQNVTGQIEGYYDQTAGVGSEGVFVRAKAATP